MIIADKILYLRKKHNLSQEELAEILDVSRQSVSKWESASSIPDIQKIMAMATFFSVTTDYLLRDDVMEEENIKEESHVRKMVTIEKADAYLMTTRESAVQTASGVFLCITALIPLIFLTNFAAHNPHRLSVTATAIVGLVWLMVAISVAVGKFIWSGMLMKPFKQMKKESCELSFGVAGILKERQQAYLPIKTKRVIFSVVLFSFSSLPLLLAVEMGGSDMFMTGMLCLLLLLVGVGVANLIICEQIEDGYEKLLLKERYSSDGWEKKQKKEAIKSAYWSIVTAIYLGWSFLTGDWGVTWIIWPVAGILVYVVEAVIGLCIMQGNDLGR